MASIIWLRLLPDLPLTRKTPWPPEPCSGFSTTLPLCFFAKSLMSAGKRVIRVSARTWRGKDWKYSLLIACDSAPGSLSTSTPRCAARRPNWMPTSCAHGRSVASSEGSLRSISTSMSVMSTSLVLSIAWMSLKNFARVRDFVFAGGTKCACTRMASSGLSTKSPGVT